MSTPESLPLRLTRRQRDLVLQEGLLPDELEIKLRFGQVEEDMLVFDLTEEQLDTLADRLVDAANRAPNPKLQDELGAVVDRIDGLLAILDPTGEDTPLTFGADLPEPLREALEKILKDPTVTSIEEAGARLAQLMEEQIGQKRDDLAGLTPGQTMLLLESPWEGADAVVLLDETLPLEELEGIRLFKNARRLLQTLHDEAPVKATVAGNLTRKFVDNIVERLDLPPGFLEEERSVSKVINERDILALHLPRVLLEMGKLISVKSSKFQVTKKGKALLAEERAGALYAQLFRTLYRHMNTEYFDHMPEMPDIQETVAFSLYVIKHEADDWQRADALAPRIFLPFIKQELPLRYNGREQFEYFAGARVFYHLERFGLLERREVPDPGRALGRADEFRKTPLYDRFIDFDLPE